MLVKDYVEETIAKRSYKYATKVSYVKGIRTLGIWDKDISSLTPQFFYQALDSIRNINTRKSISIICRSIFKDLGICADLPFIDGIPRTYDLPSQNDLHRLIDRSKYKKQLYLCMYAGLRIGEACAITPKAVHKEGGQYWLHIDQAWSQDGLHLGSSKTIGKVAIPEWLADQVLSMDKSEIWQKGKPTLLVSHACNSISRKGQKIHINPHMLRHWFATDMVRRNIPLHVVMRQLRHKNINTTMRIYAQVKSDDFIDAIPVRPEDQTVKLAKVINLRPIK